MPLSTPVGWNICPEVFEAQLMRLGSFQKGLCYIGGQEGELQDSSDIPVMQSGFGCDRILIGDLASEDSLRPVMRLGHGFD